MNMTVCLCPNFRAFCNCFHDFVSGSSVCSWN